MSAQLDLMQYFIHQNYIFVRRNGVPGKYKNLGCVGCAHRSVPDILIV